MGFSHTQEISNDRRLDLTSEDEREQCKVRSEMSKAMGLKFKKNLRVDWLEQEVILADLKRQGQFKHLKDETLVILIGLAVKEGIPGDDNIRCISDSQEDKPWKIGRRPENISWEERDSWSQG